jgi:hypothetical protein
VIALYPLVLVVAAFVLVQNQGRPGGHGWRWFGAWWASGGVFAFSFVSGFSVGLFVLPFAAAALFVVAAQAPHLPETGGFVAGVGTLALVVAWLNWDHGIGAASWLAGGLVLTTVAVAAFALTCSR